MNKQQLAARIWRSANNMRSKIDASKYKDYILGFIFYKFLSEHELEFLRGDDWDEEDIRALDGSNGDDKKYVMENIGYFIPYQYLYSTWVDNEKSFNAAMVTDALNAFKDNVFPTYKEIYDGIFDLLQTGIGELGDTAARQTKAVLDILTSIKPIPMDGHADYDVLGFIYEYLISNFAANAGKKAGEFYTPREVALLMSDIIAWELRDRENISIYDSTSGSASLLLTIGLSVAAQHGDPDSVRYYAQELKKDTYNLTRMNLVMRGVKPSNIHTKNADTLADDWPLDGSFDPLRVDAVSGNPPYSAKYKPPKSDPRFDEYGIAPKSKADYAFLLHDLYHLNADGIMTIVLPHGVLFRGDAEAQIRERLLDNGNIYAVIGMPANIFYGTGIPTIVMVLKRTRTERDVLFIDASKHFVKDGKKNRLREQDIQRAFDAYQRREDIPGYAHVASMEEIRANGFNLNIPRYVDSSEHETAPDIHACMFGGTPSAELDELGAYWDVFDGLRGKLFSEADGYARAAVDDIAGAIDADPSVAMWREQFDKATDTFVASMRGLLLADPAHVDAHAAWDELREELFELFGGVALADPYEAFQALAEKWKRVAGSLETMGTEGFGAVRAVDANMILKSKDDKEEEEQDKEEPWAGRVLDTACVRKLFLSDLLDRIAEQEARLAGGEGVLAEVAEGLSEEERELDFVKDDGSLVVSALPRGLWDAAALEVDGLDGLIEYHDLLKEHADAAALTACVENNEGTDWAAMRPKKDGTYTAATVKKRIEEIVAASTFAEEGLASRLMRAMEGAEETKAAKAEAKRLRAELVERTRETIENIDDAGALAVLEADWIGGLKDDLAGIREGVVDGFKKAVTWRAERYATTLADVEEKIEETSRELCGLLGQLRGSESDMEGIRELMKVLGGE